MSDEQGETRRVIPAKKLKELLKGQFSAKEELDEIRGGAANAVKQAQEKWGFNSRAFRVINSLWRLSPEKLADFMDDFLYMYDASGLADRAKSAPRLSSVQAEEESETAAPAPAKPRSGASVTPLRPPAPSTTETAH